MPTPAPEKTTCGKRAKILLRNRSNSSLGKIRQAGFFYLECAPPQSQFRRHDCFSIVFLIGGRGVYNDESGVSRRLRPGDLFFTFPDLAHMYGPTGNDSWNEIFVLFDGPVFDLWMQEGILSPEKAFFQLHPIAYWERKIREAIEWSRYPSQRKSLTQACRLQQLLADILSTESLELAQQKSEEDWAHFTARILEEQKSVQVSWEELAARVGVSYETFRKRFSKHVGVSPGRYHMKCLMEHACQLLLSGHGNREVSEILGFCDEFHFSRRFKQVVGCPPRDFRNHREHIPARRTTQLKRGCRASA